MPLTRYEVKERLGYGAGKVIAQALGLAEGHVSQVLNEKRADRRVARYVARKLRVRIADLPQRYCTEPDRSPAATAA